MKPFAWLLVFCLFLPAAHARVGNGRSFGSRGSRAVAPRVPNTSPANPLYSGSPYRPSRPAPPSPLEPRYGGSGFWQGLAGGLAGSFLGSLLFRGGSGYGYGYGAAPGSGLIGLVELLFLLGAGYLALRWWRQRQPLAEGGPIGAAPGPIYRAPAEEDTGEDPLETLARYDAGFDPEAFKEARTDDFFKIQAAFMARDLSGVRSLLAPEIVSGIESDIAALKAAGRINRLENITVRQIDIAEAWQEEGKEYATLHLRANLLDYTVDEKSGEVIQGSRAEPVKFEEYWTFVRGLGYASDFRNWRLSAIEQQT